MDQLSQENELGDKEEFEVTVELEKSFAQLKDHLLQEPVLAYPDFKSKSKFILDTDWSGAKAAIGAVLSQVQDGKERVISYGAKRLNSAQRNYSPSKGELFGVLYFIRHFKYFLQYRPFILRVDHESLKYIKTMEPPSGTISRWYDTITNYDFEVQYRPGPKHGNADGLSRAPKISATIDETETDEKIATVNLEDAKGDAERLPKVTQQQLLTDPATRKIIDWLRSDRIPTRAEIRQLDPKTQTLAGLLPSLKLNKDGILYYHRENNRETRDLLVLPAPLDQAFIVKVHQLLAHKKAQAVCKFMESRVYFPHMLQTTQEVLRNCTPCAVKTKPFSTGHKTKLVSPQDGSPFQKLSMDIVGPLPTAPGGFRYIVTVRCVFTRWIEAFPTRDTTSDTLLKLLHSQVFSRFGLCENLHTDNGPQFVSPVFH